MGRVGHVDLPVAGVPGETDEFYIRTPHALADDRHLVLKQGETFAVLDRYGDIFPVGLAENGLYHDGTRYLSRLSLRIGGERPLLLSSAIKADNALVAVDLTNLDVIRPDGQGQDDIVIPRGTIHVSRVLVLWDGVCYEHLRLRNYGGDRIEVPVILEFDADYADIFEVRGTVRPRRGERLRPRRDEAGVTLGYRGLDDVVRRTRVRVHPPRARFAEHAARLDVALPPHGEDAFDLTFACERHTQRRRTVAFTTALSSAGEALAARRGEICDIVTSNDQFNEWLQRSVSDLAMMVTDTPYGPFPYAGVPWFSTPFGRDSIISALECLWAAPAVGRGVLGYLASTQATSVDPESDAQPGKILHEARGGEMAALGEIPFSRYYGSHDATPLFIVLAAAYYRRTGDQALIERIWPNIEAALAWIDRDGDRDGDGFVEYLRQSPTGLVQQGWKDSHDAVSHADGSTPPPPIALCELQAYVYAAWRGAADLARRLDRAALAHGLDAKADALRDRFEARFWCEDLNTYALALDGEKKPCGVIASNAGHALFAGIAAEDRARRVGRTLVGPDCFSGWGIRTLATTERRYNPMSYHNGSIWPHDNALIASGLARYGLRDEALMVMEGLFDASVHMELHRLPELFCGFRRRNGERPTLYPVACNPQAWASASIFMFLQAALGLEVDAPARTVRLTRAKLPGFLEEVVIRNLAVGPLSLDLRLERHHDDVGISVLRRQGDVQIIAVK
jgi:glycogen debranching enzyme